MAGARFLTVGKSFQTSMGKSNGKMHVVNGLEWGTSSLWTHA